MLYYFSLIALGCCLLYFLMMVVLGIAWSRLKWPGPEQQNKNDVMVSIIIALRNEEENLDALFKAIQNLSYPTENLQIVLVNDHSEGQTQVRLEEFKKKSTFNCTLIELTDSVGKKAAIRQGVSQAHGDLLLFTDADCSFTNSWVDLHVRAYLDGAQFSSGPVMFAQPKNFWQRLMQLEFIGLVASGGSGIFLNLNMLANGANMSIPKETFLQLENKVGGKNVASGDDVFLLTAVAKHFPRKTQFIKHRDAIVVTKYESSLRNFLQQRLRWASKGGSYLNPPSVVIALIIYFTNAILLVSPFFLSHWLEFLALMVIKILADNFFYRETLRFFNQRGLIAYTWLAQLFHIPYIVFVGLLASLLPYQWKGRKSK